MNLNVRGTWPGPLVIRQGWAKANARPWNDDVLDAQLRLVRGSESFVRACADAISATGAVGVTSPPVAETGTRLWSRAGFLPYLTLDLYSRDLYRSIETPDHVVETGGSQDWSEAVSIDRAAFTKVWRLGGLGLEEARGATPRSEFLTLRAEGEALAGFAIVGAGRAVAYLQRVAVAPEFQGLGYGRSLVRAAMHWGKQHGGRTMLLNTQRQNEAAGGLYRAEGFERMSSTLEVLRYENEALT